jgi:hypothetical protein
MYQYNDRLTQLFSKYSINIYIYLALATMFQPLSESLSGLYNELRKCKHVLHFLSSLHRPDDNPDKGRNIVAKAKYIYTS